MTNAFASRGHLAGALGWNSVVNHLTTAFSDYTNKALTLIYLDTADQQIYCGPQT